MFECLFETRQVDSIGVGSTKVVDDTQEFIIPVSGVPPDECKDYYTESECLAHGCYWYDDACHGEPKDEEDEEFPWLPVVVAIGGIAAVIITIFIARR